MKIVCLCHTCALKHTMEFDPRVGPGAGFSDWLMKHPQGHEVDFLWPERSGRMTLPEHPFLNYLDNANVSISYAAPAANTITLASLASSSSLLTGRQGTAIDNTTNKYLDYLIGGTFRVGTSPTASTSIYCVVTATKDGTNWPDAFTGSDAAITITSQGIFNAICEFAANISVDSTTSSRDYPFPQVSVGQLFGGTMPQKWTLAVFQNTGAAFDSTAANFLIETQGIAAVVA